MVADVDLERCLPAICLAPLGSCGCQRCTEKAADACHAAADAGLAPDKKRLTSRLFLRARQYTSSMKLCENSPLRPTLYKPSTPVAPANRCRSFSYSFAKTG